MAIARVESATTRIDCPNCARTAEDEIKRIDGVTGARIDFLNARIYYSYDQETIEGEILKKQIEGLGHFKFADEAPSAKEELPFSKMLLAMIAIAVGLTLIGLIVEHALQLPTVGHILIYAAIAVGGWDIVRKAAAGLRQTHRHEHAMSLAVIGAAAIGQLDEAVVVVLLFGAANLLESFSLWKFSRNLIDLHDFTCAQALLKQGDSILAVAPESLQPGDVVVIREGMKIPADGRVVAGRSSVDLSSLTGESQPESDRRQRVYAGSVNVEGYLEVRVTASVKDSRIGKILQMVGKYRSAQGQIGTAG